MKNDSLYLIALYTLRGLGLALIALIPATFLMKPRLTTGFDDLMPATLLIEQPTGGSSKSCSQTYVVEPSRPVVLLNDLASLSRS